MVQVAPRPIGRPSGKKTCRVSTNLLVSSGCVVFIVGLVVSSLLWKINNPNTTPNITTTITSATTTVTAPLLSPNNSISSIQQEFHRETIDGIDVLWARPTKSGNNNNNNEKQPAGILFVAHGCHHSNTDWFPANSICNGCIGLPEEQAIVEMALDLGLIVIALSSTNRESKCWSLAKDIKPLARVLKELLNRFRVSSSTNNKSTNKNSNTDTSNKKTLREGIDNPQQQQPLPIYAFGASSGGKFVSSISESLAADFHIHLNGYISQISAKKTAKNHPTSNNNKSNNYGVAGELEKSALLCQVYITMDRDLRSGIAAKSIVEECNRGSSIDSNTDQYQQQQPPHTTNNRRCKHFTVAPLPLVPSYFSDRISDISLEESKQMVQIFIDADIIDTTTNELKNDPRHNSNWREALFQFAVSTTTATSTSTSSSSSSVPSLLFRTRGDLLVADESPITEVMNVAWGQHEMTRDGVKEGLQFCMSREQNIIAQ